MQMTFIWLELIMGLVNVCMVLKMNIVIPFIPIWHLNLLMCLRFTAYIKCNECNVHRSMYKKGEIFRYGNINESKFYSLRFSSLLKVSVVFCWCDHKSLTTLMGWEHEIRTEIIRKWGKQFLDWISLNFWEKVFREISIDVHLPWQ